MRSYFNTACFCLLMLGFAACAKQTVQSQQTGKIILTSTSPAIPVLKGLSNNPVLRAGIFIPAGTEAVTWQHIQCALNAEAINNVQRVDVYFTDAEPLFNVAEKYASVTPSSSTFEIPFTAKLGSGWHYIWFSIVLKETAETEKRIELHAKSITSAAGNVQTFTEDNSVYKKFAGVVLKKAGDDAVNTYRIPGIITTDKGTLIAVYDNRYTNSGDLPGNIDVGMSRSTDAGKTWQPMKVIMDMGAPHENNGIGDPSILFDPVSKKIWVAALWSKGNKSIAGSGPGLTPDETGQFVLVNSDDDGLTWSAPQSITSQVKNPVWRLYFDGPGNGIAMQNGTLVFPSQYWDENKMPHSAIIYSADHGKTWKSGTGAKSNTTESQLVETTPGTLMLNMRDNRGNFRSVATTTDMGASWTEHVTSYNTLQDPVCMGSLIKANVNVNAAMKDVLFFSNPNSSTGRLNITIKASLDLGETWQSANQLLIDERRSYGYSALTKIDDNTIGILYEGTRDLYFVRIPVSELIK